MSSHRLACTGDVVTHDHVDHLTMIHDSGRASFFNRQSDGHRVDQHRVQTLQHSRKHAVAGGSGQRHMELDVRLNEPATVSGSFHGFDQLIQTSDVVFG